MELELISAVGLVYVGSVIETNPIEGADRIETATVVCGAGGKWTGVVQKGQFKFGDCCVVYLQDSIVPACEEMAFLDKCQWRIRMQRLRGALSECVIMPLPELGGLEIGQDITELKGVTRYVKNLPANLAGTAMGAFPSFIPKTDEPNFQRSGAMIHALKGHPFYATVKADGSSATAYRRGEHFGVCSRNLELQEFEGNALWKLAYQYDLPNRLPDGIAIQWETVGPGIQKNPLGLKEVSALAFSAFNFDKREYLSFDDFLELCSQIGIPTVEVIAVGTEFNMDSDQLRTFAEGLYPSGKQREGVVIRPLQEMQVGNERLSFKVINLLYKD